MHPYYNALLLPIVLGSVLILALIVLTCVRISRALDQRRWDRIRWDDATGTVRPSIRRRLRMPAFSRRERAIRRTQRAEQKEIDGRLRQIVDDQIAVERRGPNA